MSCGWHFVADEAWIMILLANEPTFINLPTPCVLLVLLALLFLDSHSRWHQHYPTFSKHCIQCRTIAGVSTSSQRVPRSSTKHCAAT